MPEIDKEFYDMKEIIGSKNYDILNIVSGTLLYQSVVFMKKVGILEEFLEDKNEISHTIVEGILKMEEN